ncbi:MAG: winged helix DNA-binding domain-containing protein [Streptococcaceae bacterium]|jgi:hypothetical protein|nr:winged helix DNA-binding domain-containing protein [Streptococcaceae bacterium]
MNDILAQRLYSSGLLGQFEDPLEVIQNTVGIQSQEQVHAAEMGILLRSNDFHQEDLDDLYTSQKVVLAWANRWTLHLFDFKDWELLINARQDEHLPDSYFGGKKSEALEFLRLLKSEVKKFGEISKKKIIEMIEQELPDFDKKAYTHYGIMHRLVASGTAYIDPASPVNDRCFIYAADFKRDSSEKALEKLIPRYLSGFSPASIEDFVKWSGIKKTTVKPVWERLQIADISDSSRISDLSELIREKTILGSRFDSLMTGYLDKTWLVPEDKISTMWTKNGFLLAPIIYDGKLAGHWNYKISGKKIQFTSDIWGRHNSKQLEEKFEKIADKLKKVIS